MSGPLPTPARGAIGWPSSTGVKLAGVAAVQETQVPGDYPSRRARDPVYWFMDESNGEEEQEPGRDRGREA